MEFDFYTKYKSLDTAELLKMVALPEKMQQSAREAAFAILAERGVSGQEIEDHKAAQQAEATLVLQNKKQAGHSKLSRYFEKTFFERTRDWDFEEGEEDGNVLPEFTQEQKRSLIRYVILLLLPLLVQAMVVLIAIVTLIFLAIQLEIFDQGILFNLLLLLISLGIVVAIPFFFLKRKKNAWTAMMIYTAYYVGNYLYILYLLESRDGFGEVLTYQVVLYVVLIPLGLYSLFLLNKKLIIDVFELPRKRVENTWAVSLIFPVILFFIFYLYS